MPAKTPFGFPPRGVEYVELAETHLDDAASLFAGANAEARRRIPVLPVEPGEPSVVRDRLARTLELGPGVVAVRSGRLVGYLTSMGIPGLRGSGTAAYCPVWAHEAAGPDRGAILLELYERAAACWLDRGWAAQCVTLMPGDDELEELLVWLGFGRFSLDMVLGLPATIELPDPARTLDPDVVVGGATPDDLDELMPLVRDHYAYYAGSPVFLVIEPDEREEVLRRIEAHDEAVFVARTGARPVGFFFAGPPSIGNSPLRAPRGRPGAPRPRRRPAAAPAPRGPPPSRQLRLRAMVYKSGASSGAAWLLAPSVPEREMAGDSLSGSRFGSRRPARLV